RRTAERIGRHRHDDCAAVLHRLELAPQQKCLRPRLPGVRHLLRRSLAIPWQAIPAEVDAGGQYETVVTESGAALDYDFATLRAAADGGRIHDLYSVASEHVIAELLARNLTQTRDHEIAERAGRERPARLHQCHRDAWIGLFQRARCGRAGEAAA